MSVDVSICLLGLGEVGQILADDLSSSSEVRIATFDVQFDDPTSIPSVAAKRRPGVVACGAAGDAAAGCDLVISAVTASEAIAATRSVAPFLAAGAFYLDLNSVSPETSRQTATLVDAADGRFVEAAVMSPIGPKRLASPIFIGGPFAAEILALLHALGFTGTEVITDQIGAASAVKMARSVVIKGMEALLAESLATARHYGVEDAVLASLSDLLPDDDWPAKARYMIMRSLRHGRRRAEEMEAAAATVTAAGIDDWMSRAIVERQLWASRFGDSGDDDLDEILDTLLGSRSGPNEGAHHG